VPVFTASRTNFLSSGPTKIGLMQEWNSSGPTYPLVGTFFHYYRSDGLP